MVSVLEIVVFILFVGIGSTALLDLWALMISRVTRTPFMDWGLPGRWLLGMLKGNFVLRDGISPATAGERTVGWVFHYLVGIGYAALLPLLASWHYVLHPTFMPAFLVGFVLTSLAGLFIMVPGLGGGVCALRTPSPLSVIQSLLISHVVFALALYVLALVFVM
ncbi:DUF2938 family protein [Acetobacteraceae bacterium ESL0709]|nr:DUF2938 family protein [Acetobacteraceae bacterium ESL0697]MDF7678638.1 DUF2938 family protein [Acetobacteraceae bacterium ESL0709]